MNISPAHFFFLFFFSLYHVCIETKNTLFFSLYSPCLFIRIAQIRIKKINIIFVLSDSGGIVWPVSFVILDEYNVCLCLIVIYIFIQLYTT